MAKRGYRGKHPYSDAKVSKNPGSSKYSSKLNAEYNKLKNDKIKYDYIRTHYYYPQSTCTLTVDGDGTSVTYVAKGSENLGNNHFKRNGDNSGSLINCINNAAGHGGKIVATLSSHQNILLTQVEPGPQGNTCIASGSANLITASNQAADQISVNGKFSFDLT
mgnify:CR=1 FL=1